MVTIVLIAFVATLRHLGWEHFQRHRQPNVLVKDLKQRSDLQPGDMEFCSELLTVKFRYGCI